MKKKVLILNPYLPTLGGGEKHMGYLCKFIEEYYDAVEIDILVHNYNNIDVHSADYPELSELEARFDLKLEKTNLLKVNLTKPGNLREHFQNKRLIENMTSKYDLFINFMYQSKHIGKAKKNLYSCMFPAKRFQFDELPKKIMGRYLDFRYKNSYDYFMTNSEFTNHWQESIWHTRHKNKIIYPPVFFTEALRDREFNQKKNIILSVGRFFVGAHNKKQDELVDFYIENSSRLKGWEFHLVGALSNYPEDIEYVEKIKSRIEGYPIYLHLNAPLSELETLYREAKIFWHATGYNEKDDLFPEKMEHFGITTVEAMSYGVIPVVIRKGGQPEIVKEGVSGYLWDSKEECIQKTIDLFDDNLRIQLTEKAFERSQKFSIDNFYKQTKEVFDAL
ncbi:glycosyltransferase family 4 protein [Paenibacillus chitinolyticus]|uniref:glycosyltransferase family 4 protein n=1 Tax=Paenibacillus chitinolyticus TaxID=79263 RepID=UPI003670D7D8